MKLSVVIPAYNEEENLRKGALDSVKDFFAEGEGKLFDYEIIVVDDGSTDKTKEIVKKEYLPYYPEIRLIENLHGGKANTVMTGMLKASGDIILFTDMDQATPINQVLKFTPKILRDKFDIVIGTRQGREGAPIVRKLSAWGFSLLRAIILGLPFKDTQCGFKAFSKASVDKIIPKIKNEWGVVHFKGGAVNAGFDVELLYLAKKYGFKIAEVPVEWKYVDTERVQVVKDALAAIYDMFRIRWNDLAGKY